MLQRFFLFTFFNKIFIFLLQFSFDFLSNLYFISIQPVLFFFPTKFKKNMLFFNYLEGEDLFLPTENEILSEPMEMESSTSNTSNNMNMDILRHSTRKHKSFIWDHCESLPNGWRCVVKLNNGELCNQIFPLSVTKGSTTNTIHHLQKIHGIVRKDIANKVFCKIT